MSSLDCDYESIIVHLMYRCQKHARSQVLLARLINHHSKARLINHHSKAPDFPLLTLLVVYFVVKSSHMQPFLASNLICKRIHASLNPSLSDGAHCSDWKCAWILLFVTISERQNIVFIARNRTRQISHHSYIDIFSRKGNFLPFLCVQTSVRSKLPSDSSQVPFMNVTFYQHPSNYPNLVLLPFPWKVHMLNGFCLMYKVNAMFGNSGTHVTIFSTIAEITQFIWPIATDVVCFMIDSASIIATPALNLHTCLNIPRVVFLPLQ